MCLYILQNAGLNQGCSQVHLCRVQDKSKSKEVRVRVKSKSKEVRVRVKSESKEVRVQVQVQVQMRRSKQRKKKIIFFKTTYLIIDNWCDTRDGISSILI